MIGLGYQYPLLSCTSCCLASNTAATVDIATARQQLYADAHCQYVYAYTSVCIQTYYPSCDVRTAFDFFIDRLLVCYYVSFLHSASFAWKVVDSLAASVAGLTPCKSLMLRVLLLVALL